MYIVQFPIRPASFVNSSFSRRRANILRLKPGNGFRFVTKSGVQFDQSIVEPLLILFVHIFPGWLNTENGNDFISQCVWQTLNHVFVEVSNYNFRVVYTTIFVKDIFLKASGHQHLKSVKHIKNGPPKSHVSYNHIWYVWVLWRRQNDGCTFLTIIVNGCGIGNKKTSSSKSEKSDLVASATYFLSSSYTMET